MCKITKAAPAAKTASLLPFTTPAAPWIYINDPTPKSYVTAELQKLISTASWATSAAGTLPQDPILRTRTLTGLLRDSRNDENWAAKMADIETFRAGAMKAGANFVTIRVLDGRSDSSSEKKFGTANHLNVGAAPGAGQKIYDWLLSVLTLRETLFLIPDAKMKKIDTKLFPEYVYCPINESRQRPKDAKVQFVAMILTKPQVLQGDKIVWTVADKTGVANFHFHYRGPLSQYTWNWVMSLQPGEIRALPRMPMVQFKERKRVTFIKAPFRATAVVINGTGFMLKQIGKGFCKLGDVAKLGPRNEWVPAADVDANGKKIDRSGAGIQPPNIVCKKPKMQTDKVNEKCEKSEKTWDDGASVASTEAGSDMPDEKAKELS